MHAIILTGLCLAALIIYLYMRSNPVINIKDLVLPIFCLLFILSLIFLSQTAINAAVKGLNLWANIVLPSLFPFFVASELLNSTGFIKATGKSLEPLMRPLFNVPGCSAFALLMGITSGYPVGARITCSLLEDKALSRREAERLLAFTNNSGPLFIIGAVATGMYGMPSLGFFLLVCHIAACLTVGFIFRIHGRSGHPKDCIQENFEPERSNAKLPAKKIKHSLDIGTLFGEAVKNSIYLVINIGAFIIFFSVLINLLLEAGVISFFSEALASIFSPLGINKDLNSALLSGFFEITTGTSLASNAKNTGIGLQLIFTSFIIGWAGLSVHSQVYSIVGKFKISLKPYFLGKLLQGIIAATYTFIGLQLDFIKAALRQPVLNTGRIFSNVQWQTAVITSVKYLVFVLLIYLLFCAAASAVKRLK